MICPVTNASMCQVNKLIDPGWNLLLAEWSAASALCLTHCSLEKLCAACTDIYFPASGPLACPMQFQLGLLRARMAIQCHVPRENVPRFSCFSNAKSSTVNPESFEHVFQCWPGHIRTALEILRNKKGTSFAFFSFSFAKARK